MTDELEWARKAAELGCPDLVIEWMPGEVRPRVVLLFAHERSCYLPNPIDSINRFAAAIGAEWWNERDRMYTVAFDRSLYTTAADYPIAAQMRIAARAWGARFGGAK